MRCDFIEDISYMKTPVPPATRTVMPCPNDAEWVWFENGLVRKALCDEHATQSGWSKNSQALSPIKKYSDALIYGEDSQP